MTSTNDTHKYPIGMRLFATILCDEGIEDAKDYIRKNGYTRDDVALIKSDDVVYVKAMREIEIG